MVEVVGKIGSIQIHFINLNRIYIFLFIVRTGKHRYTFEIGSSFYNSDGIGAVDTEVICHICGTVDEE